MVAEQVYELLMYFVWSYLEMTSFDCLRFKVTYFKYSSTRIFPSAEMFSGAGFFRIQDCTALINLSNSFLDSSLKLSGTGK
jgi:hypothetical protein